MIWSCANFSRTFDKKHKSAIGLKSETYVGIEDFLIAIKSDFSQATGKIPLLRDALNKVTSNGPIVGRDLAITL